MNVDAILSGLTPSLVYALIAVVIGIESMGVPLPGEVILVSAALLASNPALAISPVWIALAASAGAIVGDNLGYLAGRHWGERMFAILGRRFPRQAGPDHLAYAEHMFTRYGAGAVFFGRFVALLRMFAGPLAGALRMPYRRFLVANALGGLLWACGITAVLYTLGARASTWLSGSSWVALGLAIIIFVVVSTALRRRLENAVSRYAKERRAQQIEETNSQKMPPDSPSGEFVP